MGKKKPTSNMPEFKDAKSFDEGQNKVQETAGCCTPKPPFNPDEHGPFRVERTPRERQAKSLDNALLELTRVKEDHNYYKTQVHNVEMRLVQLEGEIKLLRHQVAQ